MQPNQRFAISVHILTLLASSESSLTSERIADSVATNPVVIRRVMAHLRQHGLVDSRPGASGGWRLSRAPSAINLREVYQAVNHPSPVALHHHPNPRCPVGGRIHATLDEVFATTQQTLEAALDQYTVAGVLADVRARKLKRG